MSLVLTEEQESIRRLARSFVQERMPLSHFRAMRDKQDAVGFSREVWKEMAGLGLAAVAVPETWGGGGLGFAELGLVLEECGRSLAPTPLVSTLVLGANALLLGASDAQKRATLPGMCAGDQVVSLAHDEGTRHARYRSATIATLASSAVGGWRLSGEKTMVLDGHVADAFVVVARTRGAESDREGLTLFLVPRWTQGVTVTRLSLVDSRNAARVRFDGVPVREEDVIGVVDRGADVLDPLLDRAAACLAAEMLGGAQEAFDQTIAYLKTRKQFGVPIGSFQALKHRAAQLFAELELSRSIVLAALRALDEGIHDAPKLASAAKARLNDTMLLVANEAIQMHGGIGVTDELDIGFFLKRARVAGMTFGDAPFHRDRFARALGY